jgi:hypothetical protein
MDPDPDLDLDPSNITQKYCSKKTLDFSCFVTSFYRILLNYYRDIVITKLRLSRHRISNFCVHLETL